MIPLIDLLTHTGLAATGSKNTSFHVVIPSLPGFLLSDPAPDNWTTYDTARIFNTLMTEILGYETYALYGTDWGCAVAYGMYENHNTTVRAAHMSFIPFSPPDLDGLAVLNISLSPEEMFQEQRYLDFRSGDNGYFLDHSTKV
jgi:pimeloyl-ACP methyl ester carboxylesterase